MRNRLVAVAGGLAIAASVHAQSFVNWESPHVNPLALTPDGTRLVSVNTADNRVEIFDVGALTHAGSVPVGLDPVSVRARTNDEIDACVSPIDPNDTPGGAACRADLAGDDAFVDVLDLLELLAGWGPCP